jgi:hypothetical protein
MTNFQSLVIKLTPEDEVQAMRDAGYVRVFVPALNHEEASDEAIAMFDHLSKASLRHKAGKKSLGSKKDDWFPVSSQVLTRAFNSGYCGLLREQHRLGWIVRNDGKLGGRRRYSNSKTSQDGTGFCIGLKIKDEALQGKMVEKWIHPTEYRRKKSARNKRQRYLEIAMKDIEVSTEPSWEEIGHYERIKSHVTMAPGYEEEILRELKKRRKEASKISKPSLRRKALAKATRWEMSARITAEAIVTRDWWIVRCVGHRIHHPITSMPTLIRKYLRYDGKELTELDISNSQPAMYGGLLTKLNEYTKQELKEFLRMVDSLPQKKGKKMRTIRTDEEYREAFLEMMTYAEDPQDPESERIVFEVKTKAWKKYQRENTCDSDYEKNLESRAEAIQEALRDAEGIQKYKDDVASGRFYEIIMKNLEMKPEQRGEVKTAVLKAFYQRITSELSPEGKAIKELYSSAYAIMDIIKAETHAAAAIAMQRQESATLQSESFKQMNAITIHDAILVTEDKASRALTQLESQLNEAGVRAKIQIKRTKDQSIDLNRLSAASEFESEPATATLYVPKLKSADSDTYKRIHRGRAGDATNPRFSIPGNGKSSLVNKAPPPA